MSDRPTIRQGDCSTDVKDLLNLLPIYYFDETLTASVKAYQRSRGLEADGIVGPQTWSALENNTPPYVPPGLPEPLSPDLQSRIEDMAEASAIAKYNWGGRGQAPIGYIKGVTLAFANAYRQYRVGYPPAVEMAKANTHNSDKDVMSWEAGRFDAAGMSNNEDGVDTLMHLWVYLMGLGMRESSGKYCCGRDTSVPVGYYGPPSTTTEAGAWQTSYDAHTCSPQFDTLFDAFSAGAEFDNPQGFKDEFAEDVSCGSGDWQCYGDGNGYLHQEMSKYAPAYAAEVCCITLRNLRKHYGPVGRREVEIKPQALDLLQDIKAYIDQREPVA